MSEGKTWILGLASATPVVSAATAEISPQSAASDPPPNASRLAAFSDRRQSKAASAAPTYPAKAKLSNDTGNCSI